MINTGDIVISIMGHDRGEYYLVLDCDNDFVYLADGRLKTVNKPKKKNKKHISRLGKCDEFIDITISPVFIIIFLKKESQAHLL